MIRYLRLISTIISISSDAIRNLLSEVSNFYGLHKSETSWAHRRAGGQPQPPAEYFSSIGAIRRAHDSISSISARDFYYRHALLLHVFEADKARLRRL